jgi:hypothetical protein
MTLRSIPALLACLAAMPLQAQLRPLDLLQWEVFEPGRVVAASTGVGVFADQRASLAGTQGRLVEAGNFQTTWRHGRIAVEAGGTVRRFFQDQSRFADAFGGALDEHGPRRADSGDYRAATTILLTPDHWQGVLGVVRFGTRLPTTNNRVGLDRDQTDFFAVLGARSGARRVNVTAEAGLGIYGTRYANFEQSDLLIYALRGELPLGATTARLSLLAQMDLSSGPPLRGNEDLTEIRIGARFHLPVALDVELVRGLTTFSPSTGLLVSLVRTW